MRFSARRAEGNNEWSKIMIAFLIWFIGFVISFIILTFLLKSKGEGLIERDILIDLFMSLPSWLTLVIILVVLIDDYMGRNKK